MIKILKTVDWEDCKDVVLRFAKEKADIPVSAVPSNFCDFFATYPMLMYPVILQEMANRLMAEPFSDVSAAAVADENSTLFIHEDGDEALALDIVVSYLLSDNQVLSWRYLDNQKNAVAKFCHAADVDKVYLFCSSHRNASVLHLVEARGVLIAVPVSFKTNFVAIQRATDIDPAHVKYGYLRDYLPRDVGDLLSKKTLRSQQERQTDVGGSGVDNGDTL